MSGITIYMRHVRAASYCSRGMREWFALHGFDVSDFLKNGIAVEKFEATGDAMALRVADIARKEAENG